MAMIKDLCLHLSQGQCQDFHHHSNQEDDQDMLILALDLNHVHKHLEEESMVEVFLLDQKFQVKGLANQFQCL